MSYYIYSDASIKPDPETGIANYGYIGGLITDEIGKIIFCFFEKVHSSKGFKVCSIDYVEALAIETGLTHAESMGIKDVICITDSKNCVEAFQNMQFNIDKEITPKKLIFRKEPPKNQGKHLDKFYGKHLDKLYDIISVTDEFFDNVEFKHVLRHHNEYADYMSKYLQVLEGKDNKVKSKFKNMLKMALLGCNYDFTLERRQYITEQSNIKSQLKINKSQLQANKR